MVLIVSFAGDKPTPFGNPLHMKNVGVMVTALDAELSDLGLNLGWGTVLCSWARHFTFTILLLTQVYKWVPMNLLLGVTV